MSFCCGPFLLVPRVIGFSNLFCCRPRVCKVCFFVAPRWAPRPFGGARSKKKSTPPRVCFFCSGPAAKGRPKEKPRWGPGTCGQSLFARATQGVFFLLWPRAGAQRGFSFPCLSPGPEQEKKTWVVFFLLWPRRKVAAPNGAQQKRHFAHPGTTAKKILETNDTGHEQKGATKKKKLTHCGPGPRCSLTSFPGRLFRPGPAGVFVFAAAPRGRSLTHCGPGRRCLPPGWYSFFAAAPPGPGWCFFFAVAPPGRSLTHCGLGRFRQGPGGVCFFFAAAPPNPASQ